MEQQTVRIDPETHSLGWSYRTADGEWRELFDFGAAQRSASDPIFAAIYSRRPVDPSAASIRPIALLAFGAAGASEAADAATSESYMLRALKEARIVRLPRPAAEKALYPLLPSDRARSRIEDLERLLGLSPPRACVFAEEFITECDGRLVLGVAPTLQPAFVVLDGGGNRRLVPFVMPGRPPQLTILTEAGEWPPIRIGQDGLRVLPRCGMERDEVVLDFYADDLGLMVFDANRVIRPLRILMIGGPCASTEFPNASFVARVGVVTYPEPGPPTGMSPGPTDLVVREDGLSAGVFDYRGRALVTMRTRIAHQPGAYFLDGVAVLE